MDNTPYSIDAKDLEWINAIKQIVQRGKKAMVESGRDGMKVLEYEPKVAYPKK